MKNLTKLITAAFIVTALAACGGGDSLEAKKEKLEKLKTQQSEIAAEIQSLTAEIAQAGDSSVNKTDDRSKVVAVTAIKQSAFVHAIDIQGHVDGDENVTITPKMSGSISRIYVKAGQQVKAGQVLAEIENEAVKAQIKELKTNLELAKQTFERQKNLWDQKIGTEMQYLQAKAGKESLEARLVQANEGLDMYQMKSPINGIVDDLPLKVGQVVSNMAPSPNAHIRVVNMGDLKVKADVAEAYAGNIKNGNKVQLYFPDIDKSATSSVSYSARVIDPTSRTFGIEIALPSDNDYRPNMVAEIKVIDYRKDATIVVPINTLQNIDGKKAVYVAVKEGDKLVAKKREVKVGLMYNGSAEILEGLAEGDQLITVGFQDLSDNEPIKL